MNPNYQNANTGLARKVEQFSLAGSLDNKSHVVGTFKSAPDFSIPPTPASSYANIHVVLDTVHASTLTRTTQTILPEPLVKYNLGQQSRSFSNLPKAVLDNIDPEQPGARSDAALTSLKSEIAPIAPKFVALEEYNLPPSVDIALFDETYQQSHGAKEWALLEEEERSWRMSRVVDSTWSAKWWKVGQQLKSSSGFRYNSGFSNWTQIEEEERSWRMSRPIDATWSGRWRRVGEEIQKLNFSFEDLSDWVEKLKHDIEIQSESIIRSLPSRINVEEIKAATAKLGMDVAPFTLSWSQLNELEEAERQDRSSRGIDAVLSGKWHTLGQELRSYVGTSWSEWLVSIKNKAVLEVKADYRALKHVELPSVTLPSVSLPSMSLPNITLPALPDLKLGVTKSTVTTPMYTDSYPVDFTFKSSRTSFSLIQLEEEERSRRIAKGVNPVVYGMWFRVGQELKSRYALRPTFSSAARSVVQEAEIFAGKAADLLGALASSAESAFETVRDELTPAVHHDFAEHGKLPLNLYAFTAEPIDFTFRSNRTPKYILDLEEAERRDRMSHGPNRLLVSRFNRILSGGLPKKSLAGVEIETIGETMIHARDVLVEKTSEVLHEAEKLAESAVPHGWSGLFGSFAHSVADKTTHLYEAAKETLHITENPASIAFLSKAEELERSRRMSAKVDPLTAARIGRVQEELLHFTVKSV